MSVYMLLNFSVFLQFDLFVCLKTVYILCVRVQCTWFNNCNSWGYAVIHRNNLEHKILNVWCCYTVLQFSFGWPTPFLFWVRVIMSIRYKNVICILGFTVMVSYLFIVWTVKPRLLHVCIVAMNGFNCCPPSFYSMCHSDAQSPVNQTETNTTVSTLDKSWQLCACACFYALCAGPVIWSHWERERNILLFILSRFWCSILDSYSYE